MISQRSVFVRCEQEEYKLTSHGGAQNTGDHETVLLVKKIFQIPITNGDQTVS